ncbi:MAG: EamA family transporter [Cytophagales bacterium]|nr:EamA family transporter [Cytophagales bacterium]
MKVNNSLLFAVPTLIWGSTFFAIKFQIGEVEPIWSVSFRFVLAGIFLLAYCKITGTKLQFTLHQHLRIFLQGILLFGFNYWLVYLAELELTSGLVAVAFSGVIFLNILFGTIFLGRKSEKKVYLGAVVGFIGTALLFYQDLVGIDVDQLPIASLIICFSSVIIASLGNITSAANQMVNIPVIQANAFGMLYGGVLMGLIGFLSATPIAFVTTAEYIGSLLYLTIFGSIIAFGGYLTLIGKIGPDKAAYVLVAIPVIAIGLSVLFENFQLTYLAGIGMVFILFGNYIVLKK